MICNPYIHNVSLESRKSLLTIRNSKLKELSPNRSVFQTSFLQQLHKERSIAYNKKKSEHGLTKVGEAQYHPAFSIGHKANIYDETETIGDLLAEIGHHEEFHNASNS